jgi:cytoskeleton protein RodZ
MNAAVPQPIDSAPKRDAGSVLQSARQAAGLSVADVSRQLNLGESIITALETGDMEALPPAAFVRGYLRSYAKLLELDVDMLLGLLDGAGVADPDIAPVTVLSSQRVSSDPLMRWMSVAVFFVLAVMVVIWWQTKNGADHQPASVQSASEVAEQPTQSPEMLALQGEAQAPARRDDEPEVAQQQPVTDAADSHIEVDPQPLDTEAAASEQPLAEDAAQSADAESTSQQVIEVAEVTPLPQLEPAVEPVEDVLPPEPEPQSDDSVIAADTVASPVVEVAVAEAATEAPAEPAAPADAYTLELAVSSPAVSAGTDELVLMVDGSSWAEVRDALGQTLYYGLYDSPAPLRLTGQLPFVVFLGNSPAVTILFNGETYDQTPFNRDNNTARFALDGAGLRRP